MNKQLSILLAVLAVALGGCAPRLTAVSTPPPTRDAEHVRDPFSDDVVHLSRGVAIAFDCYEGFFPDVCKEAVAKVDDPKIAQVFRAHLEREKSPYGPPTSALGRTGFVLVGVTPGKTSMRVRSSQGDSDVTIIVE